MSACVAVGDIRKSQVAAFKGRLYGSGCVMLGTCAHSCSTCKCRPPRLFDGEGALHDRLAISYELVPTCKYGRYLKPKVFMRLCELIASLSRCLGV